MNSVLDKFNYYFKPEYCFLYYYQRIWLESNIVYGLVMDDLIIEKSNLFKTRNGVFIKPIKDKPIVADVYSVSFEFNKDLRILGISPTLHYTYKLLCNEKPTESQILNSFTHRKLLINL